jgi:hypothetical protein
MTLKHIAKISMLTALILHATAAVSQNASEPLSAVCDGRLRLEVNSLVREGPGVVAMAVTYENLSNLNMRLGVYSGGANGRDTFLVSDNGEMWMKRKARHGGGTTGGIVYVPGLKMKVTMRFEIRTGGQEAKSFHLTNWLQLLAEKGMTGPREGGWCKMEIRSIPLAG